MDINMIKEIITVLLKNLQTNFNSRFEDFLEENVSINEQEFLYTTFLKTLLYFFRKVVLNTPSSVLHCLFFNFLSGRRGKVTH